MYDVLIHLNMKHLPRQHEAVDITTETNLPVYGKVQEENRFPVTDFDPVQMYLKELRVGACCIGYFMYLGPFLNLSSAKSR